jgi:hypothetical protein
MLACVLLDHFLMNRAQCGWFKFYDLKVIFFHIQKSNKKKNFLLEE